MKGYDIGKNRYILETWLDEEWEMGEIGVCKADTAWEALEKFRSKDLIKNGEYYKIKHNDLMDIAFHER